MMRTGWPLATLLGIALLGVACGDDPAAEEDDRSVEPGAEDDVAAAETEPAGEVDVALGETELGEVLVDGDGMTLYLFTEDPPEESTCLDDCLAAWPPLLVDGEPRTGNGVDASLVDTIERPDDGVQLTYDDAPLYTWASDQRPGDVTGQGVQEVWFVVSADGSAVMDTDAAGQDDTPGGEQETGSAY
jgi:predicted lipoprotein with Yx(FWY)xxD motif